MKIARQHGGAFLCDGVGLGKTFVGLMLIERLVLHEGKRVVLFAPKATKEGVWEPHLREWLPHIGGVGGGADFSNLAVFSHTDLGRKGDFPERFQRIAELADVVIIDEAHHFRNPGSTGRRRRRKSSRRATTGSTTCSTTRSARRPLFMLTATPINNRLSDFRHMAELFTRRDETLLRPHPRASTTCARTSTTWRRRCADAVGHDATDVAEQHGRGAGDPGRGRDLPRSSSCSAAAPTRARARSARRARPPSSPTASAPQVAEYSIRKTYGQLLDMFEKAFTRKNPLFTLPMYYPLAWYKGPDDEHRSVRGEPPEAGRRPDPHPVPEALRELGRRLRALLRPPAAEAAGLRRGPQRDRRREEAARALEGAERRDPRLRDAAAARLLGRGRATRPRTRTSSRRRCSTPSSASTATSTTSTR